MERERKKNDGKRKEGEDKNKDVEEWGWNGVHTTTAA
jgi:hypothetical protein